MRDEQWANLARELGAQPFELTYLSGGDDRHRSFAMRLRERRGPAAGPSSKSHVLMGSRNGTRYLLQCQGEKSIRIGMTVELGPSLGMCAFIGTPAWIRGLGKTKHVYLGDPGLDSDLCLEAAEPERMVELLRPQSEADVTLLRAIISESFVVTDTTVVDSTSATVVVEGGIPLLDERPPRPVTANEICMKLDRMIWVGRELAIRRSRVRVTPEAQQMREAWAAVARARGLAFDPDRLLIEGETASARFSIGVETRLAALAVEESFKPFSTYLSASFVQPLGLNLRVEKAGMLNRLSEVFGADIVLGDKPFDKAFSVSGTPEATVRERLRPAAAALVDAHAHAAELTLDDGGIFLLIPGILSTPDHVGKALDLLKAIVDTLRIVPTQGPYRS